MSPILDRSIKMPWGVINHVLDEKKARRYYEYQRAGYSLKSLIKRRIFMK